MAKFAGNVGYAEQTVETSPGVWETTSLVREYVGDVLDIGSRYQNTNSVNGDVTVSNKISIIADSYAMKNPLQIRWVEFMGIKCLVTNVEVQSPRRLILSLGGVFNGE